MLKIQKIISGGQTGVDRAALDFALANNIPCGGWCPKGRLAEDGTLPVKYPLTETSSENYAQRTKENVQEADGTLVITTAKKYDQGTLLTINTCKKSKKPFLIIDLKDSILQNQINDWIEKNIINVLNISGPRESYLPGIYEMVYGFLEEV